MDIEKEIREIKSQLNNLQRAYNQSQKNQVPITDKTDTAYNKVPQVDENTNGVEENDSAICDIAMFSDENSSAIEELAGMIDDLEQRVTALEEKEE